MSRTSRFLSSPLMQLVSSSYPFRVYLKHLARTGNSSVDTGDRISEVSCLICILLAHRIHFIVYGADNTYYITQLVRIQSAHLQGYNSALASSIRDGPVRNLAPVYAQLGRLVRKARASHTSSSSTLSSPPSILPPSAIPPHSNSHSTTNRASTHEWRSWREDSRILLVWGTKDRVVPFRYAERVLTLVGGEVGWQEGFSCSSSSSESSSAPLDQEVLGDGRKDGRDGWGKDQHAKLVTIEGAGHGLTESHAELVVRLLDGFFAAVG